MDPDEFDRYLASLPPEEQQRVLAEMGLAETNQMPPGFGGPYQPELGMGSYSLAQMQQLPPDIEYGDVQPFGLDELSQAYNIMQDQGALALDPAIRMQAGRGAFDVDAFKPVVTPIGEPLDLAGSRYIDMLANSAGGGYESYLAQHIKPVEMGGAGMDPGTAVASLWADINNPAPGNEALAEQLKASLPPPTSTDPGSFAPSVTNLAGDFSTPEGQFASADVATINSKASELFDRMASDPVVGYTDPQTGLPYAGSYETPSGPMEKFDEYGLPYPTASYTDPEYLPPINQQVTADKAAAMPGAQAELEAATGIRDQTAANMEAMTKAWDEAQAAPAAPSQAPPSALVAAQNPAARGVWGSTAPTTDFEQPFDESAYNQSMSSRDVNLPALGDVWGSGATPTTSDLPFDTDTVYDQAYNWEEEERKRRAQQTQQQNAAATQGTRDPFVSSSNGRVLGTYDFAEGSPEEQAAMGQIANVLYTMQGNPNVQTGAMSQGPSWYQPAVDAAESQWGQSYLDAERLRNYATPDMGQHAAAAGLAYAMEQAGRTPLNDVLMQGALGRQALMPYNSGY